MKWIFFSFKEKENSRQQNRYTNTNEEDTFDGDFHKRFTQAQAYLLCWLFYNKNQVIKVPSISNESKLTAYYQVKDMTNLYRVHKCVLGFYYQLP